MSAGRVLVIEDDVAVASLLRRGLALKGIEVTIAEDGSAGREAWKAGDFDLILLDVMLPEVEGISLCSEMRTYDETPVLILTARDEDGVKDRGMTAGATDYISKPFDFEELLSRVDSHLRS